LQLVKLLLQLRPASLLLSLVLQAWLLLLRFLLLQQQALLPQPQRHRYYCWPCLPPVPLPLLQPALQLALPPVAAAAAAASLML
jgi:hypothetical protein